MTNHPSNPSFTPERGQFLRVEKYAVQAPHCKSGGNNLHKVASEAARIDGFCPHVEHPVQPRTVWGVGPLEAAALAQEWSSRQTGTVFHKPSQTTRSRKYRDDKPSALVGVISVPPGWTPDERWERFVKQSVDWLIEYYGADRLKSVLEHLDEGCQHLHFWVVARDNEDFSAIHPGERAVDAIGRKSPRVLRDVAYKKAMSQLLDEFHTGVGSRFGLQRETVAGKRFTRAQWQRRQFWRQQREDEMLRRISDAVTAALLNQNAEQSTKVDSPETTDAALPSHTPQLTHPLSNLSDGAIDWVRPRGM